MDPGSRTLRSNRRSKNLEYKISKIKNKKSRKWSEQEMETLLQCIQKHGHTAFKELQECLPNKDLGAIKNFLISAKCTAKELPTTKLCNNWLDSCNVINKKQRYKKWDDSIQIAQVMKFLSIDGLLECHPLPENCDGIDFSSAYRLLYQALMGYPMQPVNKETADFITETIGALILDVNKELEYSDTFKNLMTFLKDNYNGNSKSAAENVPSTSSKSVPEKKSENFEIKKPIKTYQKKKPVQVVDESTVVKLNILPTRLETESKASSLECFVIAREGSNVLSLIDVPVKKPEETDERKNQLAKLYKSPSYNPFQVPEEMLKLW